MQLFFKASYERDLPISVFPTPLITPSITDIPQGSGQRTELALQPPSSLQPIWSSQGALDVWRAVPYPPLHRHTPGQCAKEPRVFSAGLGPRASTSHEEDVGAWRRNVRKEQLEKTPRIHGGNHGRYCNTWWEVREVTVEKSSEGNTKGGAGQEEG